jgi:hypothetical protein
MNSREHMGKVKQLGCAVCQIRGLGETPAEVHHLFNTDIRSDLLVAPLCREHHQGATGFHGLKREGFQRMHKLTEYDLLDWTLRKL